MLSKHLKYAAAALNLIAVLPGAALAQGQVADSQAVGSDVIVVTARRRAESLQNAPVAITAFSQTTLDQKAIRLPLELSKAVPGRPSQHLGKAPTSRSAFVDGAPTTARLPAAWKPTSPTFL